MYISAETLRCIKHHLLQEGVCAVPTETVYGLPANGFSDRAVAEVFALKKRPTVNPLIVHYSSLDSMKKDVVWTACAAQLAEKFWPGPLTLILKRSEGCRVSSLVSAGLSTLAVRISAHPFMQDLLKHLPFPLAAPSANPSGKLSPTQAAHVKAVFPHLPVVDGGLCAWGIESTVLDLTGGTPRLLRPGSLAREEIEKQVGPILDVRDMKDQAVVSPGLLAHHYAPQKPLRLHAQFRETDEAFLTFGPSTLSESDFVRHLSLRGDLTEAASRLFSCLHTLDHSSMKRIAVMPIPEDALGCAINDRLRRAALPLSNEGTGDPS